jgi:tetratricopeptide (TPR) repeat protein
MKEEGRLYEAEVLLKQALEADKRMFGSDSLEASIPMRQLAALYEQEHNLDAAESLLKAVIQICSKASERRQEASLQTAYALDGLARIYVLQGHTNKAKPALEESLRVYNIQLGETNPCTRLVKQELAAITVPQE